MMPDPEAPRATVLFVCKSNRGKSQMADALLRAVAGDGAVEVHSAGTQPALGKGPNSESVASLAEIGVDMAGGVATPVDDDVMRRGGLVAPGTGGRLPPPPASPASTSRPACANCGPGCRRSRAVALSTPCSARAPRRR